MDVKKIFRSQPSGKLDELQDEPARKCRKVDDTHILEYTDDEFECSSWQRMGEQRWWKRK